MWFCCFILLIIKEIWVCYDLVIFFNILMGMGEGFKSFFYFFFRGLNNMGLWSNVKVYIIIICWGVDFFLEKNVF